MFLLSKPTAALETAIDAINRLKVALSPYLPTTSDRLHSMLGLPGAVADQGWSGRDIPPGTALGPASPLYKKV